MSLADELELETVADELIEEYGRVVSLVPPGTLSDAAKPWKGTSGDGTPIPAFAVFAPLRKELVPGVAVAVGDQKATIATKQLAAIPDADWYILDGTTHLAIVAPALVRPGNTSFVYTAQVRASGQ